MFTSLGSMAPYVSLDPTESAIQKIFRRFPSVGGKAHGELPPGQNHVAAFEHVMKQFEVANAALERVADAVLFRGGLIGDEPRDPVIKESEALEDPQISLESKQVARSTPNFGAKRAADIVDAALAGLDEVKPFEAPEGFFTDEERTAGDGEWRFREMAELVRKHEYLAVKLMKAAGVDPLVGANLAKAVAHAELDDTPLGKSVLRRWTSEHALIGFAPESSLYVVSQLEPADPMESPGIDPYEKDSAEEKTPTPFGMNL
jgi:hypothetical protein